MPEDYELYDLDGAFRLVTLRDDSGIHIACEDGDFMEIDQIETILNDILAVTPAPEEEQEQEQEQKHRSTIPAPSDGLVATLSNSLILSPTSFGARMALRTRKSQPKLIPEPEPEPEPVTVAEPEYDYEVDTSNYAHTLRQRNVSSYTAAPLNDLLVREHTELETDPTWMQQLLRDNLMSQSYSLRKQMDLINNRIIEVHHHYYGAGLGQSSDITGTNSLGSGTSGLASGSSPGLAVASRAGHSQISVLQPGPSVSLPGQLSLSLPGSSLTVASLPGHLLLSDQSQSPVLPFPWTLHPLPYLITTYLQLVTNAGALLYGVHLLWTFVQVIKSDIAHKLTMHSSSILVDIDTCRRQYIDNNCFPDEIVPALEKQCSIWLKCMKQDPYGGGNKSLVSAETIGMILNSLIEPLGLKFWLVITGLVVVMLLCNFSFGYLRAKTYYGWRRP